MPYHPNNNPMPITYQSFTHYFPTHPHTDTNPTPSLVPSTQPFPSRSLLFSHGPLSSSLSCLSWRSFVVWLECLLCIPSLLLYLVRMNICLSIQTTVLSHYCARAIITLLTYISSPSCCHRIMSSSVILLYFFMPETRGVDLEVAYKLVNVRISKSIKCCHSGNIILSYPRTLYNLTLSLTCSNPHT